MKFAHKTGTAQEYTTGKKKCQALLAEANRDYNSDGMFSAVTQAERP